MIKLTDLLGENNLYQDGGSTVECEKCDWRWKISDGGKDPYVCHKCGFDNSDRYGINEFTNKLERDMIKLADILNEAKKQDNTFEDFAETRGKGAEKIADTAKEKGGLAMLTYNHFKVKAPYYKKASEGKFDIEKAKKEYEQVYKSISLTMTQIEFQKAVGRLEVLGELIIRDK